MDEYIESLSYDDIRRRVLVDPDFRDGLLVAARVCRAQGRTIPCPSDMAAVYLERLAAGERP